MKWIIDLESFIVEAETEVEARQEAKKLLDTCPDLLVENITPFE